MTLSEIYRNYSIGSTGFCKAVETHCGYNLSVDEIERISDAAPSPKDFDTIYHDHEWWKDDASRGQL